MTANTRKNSVIVSNKMKSKQASRAVVPDLDSREPLIKIARRTQEYCNMEETRHREALYIMITAALYVRYGMNEPGNWADLCADSYWRHRRDRDCPKESMTEKEKSKFTGIFLFAGPDEIRYDRAWKYSQVVHYYYSLGVQPKALKAQLKKDDGIDAVVARVAANNAASTETQKVDTDEDGPVVSSEHSRDDHEADACSDHPPELTKERGQNHTHFLLKIALDDVNVGDAMTRLPGKKILIYAVQEESDEKYVPYRAVSYSSGTDTKKN